MAEPDAKSDGMAFAVLLTAVSLGFVWILLPWGGSILWGAVIALLFAPLYRRLLQRLHQRRTLAALLTLLAVLVVLILPFAFLSGALAREAAALYQRLSTHQADATRYLHGAFDALPTWAGSFLDSIGLSDFETLQRRVLAGVAQGSQFIATKALSIGQNTFEFVVGLFVTLYLAFFLIRDGADVVRAVRRAIPMDDRHQQQLLDKFSTVVRATVKGNLVVATIQGALGGVAFWWLGATSALLWGTAMAFVSLLPAVGAALIWAPFAIYLVLSGSVWQGIALVAYGVLVIGLVDNLLRPVLVGKDTQMPDYMVMITTLGGMAVFGINGFVIGPTIAAMFIAAWHLYASSRAEPPP